MKLAGREAAKYFQRPDPNRAGLLIYGADTMRVALKRQEVIAALIGKTGEEEMRLTRINAADLRKDPALVMDALKAVGFFPGPRAVFVEEASDGLAAVIEGALNAWAPGDAQLVVTAGQLAAKAKLRVAFEKHPNAYAAGLYDDPPSRDEIEAELARAGLPNIAPGAMTDLVQLANDLTPGDFRQTLEKISLYKMGDSQPVASEDILACAPASTEADMDDMLNIVAEGHTAQIGPLMQRLAAQGVQPVGLCIALSRHFRTLFAAAADPAGPAQGIARMRPPVYGARRDRMQRQAQAWGAARLQDALGILVDTDLALRSGGQTAPGMAVIERSMIRMAQLLRRR